ncbi:type I secretion system permease/ATPase [Ahrensia kielensis]|uniref:type I secretion system permease/ATPase n=1 Tax=Ahrensia kielensis TaxID=76980 RepID=UPI00037CE6E6|nr:type I secretion system permease/ATPase [Ahrensia kielensis]
MKLSSAKAAKNRSRHIPSADSRSSLPALLSIARNFGLSFSEETIRIALEWDDNQGTRLGVNDIADRLGLVLHPLQLDATKFDNLHSPILVATKDSGIVVIDAITNNSIAAFRRFEGGQAYRNEKPIAELIDKDCRTFLVRPRRSLPDARIDAYIAPVKENWLRKTLFPKLAPYGSVMAASVMINMLALSGIIFSMQVYDRVIPAQSYPTLAVLFSGVVLALFFEFFLKQSRTILLDVLGRNAGLRLSETVFGHALRVRNDHRPKSTGSFIAQIRDIDTMREAMTSTSVGVLMDLPFFLLFTAIFWWIAGPLVLIPICALLAIILPGVLLQPKLRKSAQNTQREAALRNAILVETIQGIEDIKSMQAEDRFEGIWQQTSQATSIAQTSERRIVSALTSWTQIVQQSVYAVTVAIGAPMVMVGEITTGTLVGASILGARMIAPMAQVSAVLSRLQQARSGAQGLDKIMKMPVDHPDEESRVTCARVRGNYEFQDTVFKYRSDLATALIVKKLCIAPGERIGLVGRNGAGKSTLLQALSGQLFPASGQLRIDSLSVKVIDPADLRRDISYLSQNARLFYGSLRENLSLGCPEASENDMLSALEMAGGEAFLSCFERGWDHQILEGGIGLSGGQKQSILLARFMLRRSSVMLLDEPTSAMDDKTEKGFIDELGKLTAGSTLIVATHRHRILQLVDRLIVMDKGRIILDGPREDILAKMRGEDK